ncbi:hypothetical protein ABH935_000187 [Catenulispora sp. GAS73]|uniref:hypothetical protein n=1 Tax=Catenulispora sp. GAS73 TaxID=3156269 RepID=UPI0035189ECB
MNPTGREAGDDVRAAAAMEPMAPIEPIEPTVPTEPTVQIAPIAPIQQMEQVAPRADAPAGGAGESTTQGPDPASPEARDPQLPRRVPQPSQLRGQAAITPAQPAEQTLRHLRDVLDRLP